MQNTLKRQTIFLKNTTISIHQVFSLPFKRSESSIGCLKHHQKTEEQDLVCFLFSSQKYLIQKIQSFSQYFLSFFSVKKINFTTNLSFFLKTKYRFSQRTKTRKHQLFLSSSQQRRTRLALQTLGKSLAYKSKQKRLRLSFH